MFKEEWTSPPHTLRLPGDSILQLPAPFEDMDGGGEECVNVFLHLCVQHSCANCALAVKLVFIVEGLPHGSVLFLLKFQNFFLRPDKYIRKHAELRGPVRGDDCSSLDVGLCRGAAAEGFTHISKC